MKKCGILSRKLFFSLLLGIVTPITSVQSAVINGGFEQPPGGIGCEGGPPSDCRYKAVGTSDSAPPGWTHYSPGDINFRYGLYTPSSDSNPNNNEYDPLPSPVTQVLYIDQYWTDGQGPGGGRTREIGFEQMMPFAVSEGTYNLSVAVGNPNDNIYDYRSFGGYGIELFARETSGSFDETIIAQDRNGTSIGEGIFASIMLNAELFSTSSLLGQALGIRIYNLNLYLRDGNGNVIDDSVNSAVSSIAFDNVVLTGSAIPAVPVPAAVWLFGTALLGLVGLNRRRKSALATA